MLGATGQAIWKAYDGDQLDAGSAALVRELARCADTLDRLDDLVVGRGNAWVTIVFDDMGEVHLIVDKVLDQRRNHQLAFKQLVSEVRAAKIQISPELTKTLGDKPETSEPGDMLAVMRAAKEARERQLG